MSKCSNPEAGIAHDLTFYAVLAPTQIYTGFVPLVKKNSKLPSFQHSTKSHQIADIVNSEMNHTITSGTPEAEYIIDYQNHKHT